MIASIRIYRRKDNFKSYGFDRYFFAISFPERSRGNYVYLYSFYFEDNTRMIDVYTDDVDNVDHSDSIDFPNNNSYQEEFIQKDREKYKEIARSAGELQKEYISLLHYKYPIMLKNYRREELVKERDLAEKVLDDLHRYMLFYDDYD